MPIITTNENFTQEPTIPLIPEQQTSLWRGFKVTVNTCFKIIAFPFIYLIRIYEPSDEPILSEIQQDENLVSEKFSANNGQTLKKFKHLKVAGDFDQETYEMLIKKLAHCNKAEEAAIKHIQTNYDLTSKLIKKILEGAHVWLVDDGAFRRDLEEHGVPRICSHPTSDGIALSFQGDLSREALFSDLTKEEALQRLRVDLFKEHTEQLDNDEIFREVKTISWVQLERNPITNFSSFCAHSWDYICYKTTGKNIGPNGSSRHIDTNPVILFPKK